MITEFASSQGSFASLRKEDQKHLLVNNVPLYLQYILARYFSAESGLEQITWIMEGQVSIQTIEDVTELEDGTYADPDNIWACHVSGNLYHVFEHKRERVQLSTCEDRDEVSVHEDNINSFEANLDADLSAFATI